MAARITKNTDGTNTEEQSPEQAIEVSEASEFAEEETPEEPHTEPSAAESDPMWRRRLPRKRVLITIIAAITVVVLAVAGWLVYTNELAVAKTAYETSISDQALAASNADKANHLVSETSGTLSEHIAIAETLATQLGDGTDIVKAAIAAIAPAKAVLAATTPISPKVSPDKLSKTPTAAEYNKLTASLKKATANYKTYTKALAENIKVRNAENTRLVAAWTAQAATATATAEATIAANPDGSQEAKDAVTAAAKAIVALKDSLGATAPELWKALQDSSASLVAAEQAYQAQKAAEAAEAARQAAAKNNASKGGSSRAPSRGSSGGSSSGGSSGGNSSGYSLSDIEALLAAQKGIPASSVHCFNIANGVGCNYPGGYYEVTI